MKKIYKSIKAILQRWGIKVAWIVAVIAVVAVMTHRCTGGPKGHATACPPVDSLLIVNDTTLLPIEYCGFNVYFDSTLHLPACVTYCLTIDKAQGSLPRAENWLVDEAVAGCATVEDYTRSNYQRGHMAPAGDMRWSEQAMNASFTMTNVCPQNRHLNQGGWSRLEEKVREWVMRDSTLIVITGPIISPADTLTIGHSRVRVPGSFYKIVVAPQARPMRVAAFVYPNKPCDDPLSKYLTTVSNIENLTGLKFLEALPHNEQDRLKASSNLNPWIK